MTEQQVPPLHLLILAGGRSTRSRGGDSTPPKQFRAAGGRILFLWSVHELLLVPQVASLTVVVPDPWRGVCRQQLEQFDPPVPWLLAAAGPTRTASTLSGAETLAAGQAPAGDDLVAVHDAARPFASHHLLHRLAVTAAAHGAAVPGVPVPDTVVQIAAPATQAASADVAVARYLQRSTLQAVQTPQVFRWRIFLEAHRWCGREKTSFTDDGGLLAARGVPPVVVMGEPANWKITTEDDWERAEGLFRRRAARR